MILASPPDETWVQPHIILAVASIAISAITATLVYVNRLWQENITLRLNEISDGSNAQLTLKSEILSRVEKKVDGISNSIDSHMDTLVNFGNRITALETKLDPSSWPHSSKESVMTYGQKANG